MTEPPRKGELDERGLGRAIAIGLPLVTIVAALGVGVALGFATAILVVAGGVLLGVIGILWASLRVLSGDAPLPADLEALEGGSEADPLLARKKMLLRALKDLDNEKAVGKLGEDDHAQITATYRAELKEVLRSIDASLEPFRGLAEEAAANYLESLRLKNYIPRSQESSPESGPKASRSDTSASTPEKSRTSKDDGPIEEGSKRVACPSCEASNEADAKFCKECGAVLSSAPAPSATVAATVATDTASDTEADKEATVES